MNFQDCRIRHVDRFKEREEVVERLSIPHQVGCYAMDMAKTFAVVAATVEGEDASGRAKLRLLDPDEVVQRSCDIAEKMFTELASRGWMLEIDRDSPEFLAEREARK